MHEEGFLLIEVIVSALIVGLIVVATFTGFDNVNRFNADQRSHNQAVILAEQSQEQLRTDPVSTLDQLEGVPHTYSVTLDANEYKITQEAAPSNGSAATTGCNATETTKQTGANVQITSSVTWLRLNATSTANRPKVSLTSIITPPTGSGLEVDAGNAPAPTAGVAGIVSTVTYKPAGSTATSTVEGTTNSNGCFVFGDIPATAATVAISQKAGFVTPAGLLKWPTKELVIAPNLTTHYAVTYYQGGAIKANFQYEKKAVSSAGKTVTGNTFVVYNSAATAEPKFEVGSPLFTYEVGNEEHYYPKTETYETSATTAKGSLYSAGDLFPFPESNKWLVYAGDCLANNPASFTSSGLTGTSVTVLPGETVEAAVPMSKVNLTIHEGTKASPGALNTEHLPAKITNTACSSTVPLNASAVNLVHEQKTSEGGLTSPFQPFGAYSLTVEHASHKYTYAGVNETEAGTSPAIYFGAKTQSEITKTITTDKEAVKTDTELVNKLKGAQATEEAEKKAREKTEGEERAKWKKEYECSQNFLCILNIFEPKINKSEYEAKEKAQEKVRKEDEKKESEKQSTRPAELKAAEEALKAAETGLKTAEAEQKEEEETKVKVE